MLKITIFILTLILLFSCSKKENLNITNQPTPINDGRKKDGTTNTTSYCNNNSICEIGETINCSDCSQCNFDKNCDSTIENSTNCPNDCPIENTIFCNNNGICEKGEENSTCSDCVQCNNNGTCEPNESLPNCPLDCTPLSSCNNNNQCDSGENQNNCPNDCATCNFNGICDPKENSTTCPNDCLTTNLCDYDSICESGESISNCSFDCRSGCPIPSSKSIPSYSFGKPQESRCFDSNTKKICDGNTHQWGNSQTCTNGCKQGRCLEEIFDGNTFTIRNDNYTYALSIPKNLNGKTYSEIFSNLPIGTSIYYFINSNWLSINCSELDDGSFGLDDTTPINTISQAFQIQVDFYSINIYSFNISNFPSLNAPVPIVMKGRYAFFSIPYCTNNFKYTASKVINEVKNLPGASSCTYIAMAPQTNYSPNPWWSSDDKQYFTILNGIKDDFEILSYFGYWLYCLDPNTNFTWTPSCHN